MGKFGTEEYEKQYATDIETIRGRLGNPMWGGVEWAVFRIMRMPGNGLPCVIHMYDSLYNCVRCGHAHVGYNKGPEFDERGNLIAMFRAGGDLDRWDQEGVG